MTDPTLSPDELEQFRAWQAAQAEPQDAPAPADVPTSPQAEAMVEAGATPMMDIDTGALLRRLQELETAMAAMQEARGIPSDPIGAHVQALRDHVTARAASMPDRKDEFADLVSAMAAVSDKPTADEAAYIRACLDDMERQFEGDDYIRKLAASLQKLVLKG